MRIVIPLIAALIILSGCETPGDKFPILSVNDTLLGKINNRRIFNAYFINAQTGFAIITRDTVVMTTDSCKSFSLSLAGKGASFECIRFVDEKVGFVIDRNDRIFKTDDGGVTWSAKKLYLPEAFLMDLICLNHDTAFIAAGGDPKSPKGYIVKTTDGGITWYSTMTRNLLQISFLNDSTGFAAGWNGIIKTTDCGNTWDSLSSFPANDVLFFDPLKGYFTYNRSLYLTVNGGKDWKLVKNIANPRWVVGDDFSRIENLSVLNETDLIFSLNARLIKVTSAQKFFQYEFTRPYYQFQMIAGDKAIVYGFENLILVQF